MFLRYWTYNFETINVHLVRKDIFINELFKR